MSKDAFVPMRRCIACRTSFPKENLIRFTKGQEGIAADPKGTAPGRGFYICRKKECIELAFSKNYFAKVARRSVSKDELKSLKETVDTLI